MKRIALTASIAAATLLLAALTSDAAPPQQKSHQFRCTDRNTSLYFLVPELNGKLGNGFMYVESMQVAVLTTEMGGRSVIKASVYGNSAENIAFQLHMSGSVMVAKYDDPAKRVEVCKASYKYQ